MSTLQNIPLFFILGRERSGTTMLRVTLNNHPLIHIPPESPFILHLYKKYNTKSTINLPQFIADLKLDPFLIAWNINDEELTERLTHVKPATFQNYCKEILGEQQTFQVLGDKNPTYSLFGPTLHRIFPAAKFIWIIRDYRAQVNSMLKVNFEKKIVSSLAARWVDYNKAIEKLKKKFPEQVLLIKYEDLVRHPTENYQNICNFLNIDYDATMLTTNASKEEFYPDHHKSLSEKINTKHIDEWKTELTQKQIKTCEAIAGNYGVKYGYKKSVFSNSTNYFQHLFGIWYGKLYVPFIKLMYTLPFSWRVFINRKIIYKNAAFWKELKEHY